jgi:hypothetical protein
MSRFEAQLSRFAGTRDGTKVPGTRGTVLRTVPPPDVPNVPPKCPVPNVPVSIHGVQCSMTSVGGGYVITGPDGAVLAREASRFLVVARAALNLAPARAFAQGA